MPGRKRDAQQDDQQPDEGQDPSSGRSVLVVDQPSFVDEGTRSDKQLADGGRKVADVERVGALTPDTDADAPAD